MNTSVINIKVERSFKSQVQKLADEFGLSVSALIHVLLKHALTTKTITLGASEKPNAFFKKTLEESEKDIKAGQVVTFRKPADVLKYLDSLIAKDKHVSKN